MGKIKFTCLLVVIGFSVTAQLRIQPKIGLENSKTSVTYNNQSITPMGIQFTPQLALNMSYTIKKGHGVFAGISTSAPSIDFNFSDMQTAATSYTASRDNMQFRFEGGYQFMSKPIYFSKPSASTFTHRSRDFHHQKSFSYLQKQSCGQKQNCGQKLSCGQRQKPGCTKDVANRCGKGSRQVAKNPAQYMRIIPSAGLAFIPGQPSELENKLQNGQTTYSYKAGAWNTALIAGAGFEFGSNNHPNFIVTVNYLKGLGNMDAKSFTTVSNGKTVSGNFHSNTSTWSIAVGIPFNIAKKKAAPKQQEMRKQGHCGQQKQFQQRGSCGGYRMLFDR